MDASEFISPLETVQVLSVFSYLNILSDVLCVEKYLDENDQNKRIPVINAMYHYLQIDRDEKSGIQKRKLHLTKKLINGTDLYGAKENEIPDPYFIDTLFQHIVNNLVFDRFINVFGFIAEVVRTTENDSLIKLQHRLKKVLISLRFQNEYGENSQLTPLVVDSIFVEIIEPLLPRPQNFPVQITSIDYIYAMAGNMFLRSDQTETAIDKFLNGVINETADEGRYQEYIEIAHTIEQLVLADKVDKSALQIFALPALINYVHKERKSLESVSTESILSSPDHWKMAYRLLFGYLNDAFAAMEKVQNKNYRYQFYSALSQFKNRTTLAREIIEINCPPLSEQEMEQEILNYKNNPQSYTCKFPEQNSQNQKSLQDLNNLYQEMVTNVANKYYIYERKSCRAVFGNDFIQQMDNTSVVVSKGLIRYFYSGGLGIIEDPIQMVNASHDLLQFHFPDSGEYLYYALVRNGYNISLIKEADNPKLFREILGLDENQRLRYNFFPIDMKTKEEKFVKLITKIANDRANIFRQSLESEGYDETRKEWWVNFGLSLVPFYSCIKDIKEKNAAEAAITCPLDALFFIPVAGEMGIIATKMASAAGRSILALTETTLRTITIRTSIRTVLRITGRSLINEITRFAQIFTKEMFRNFGIALFRFIDPGFELAFTLGHKGLRSIKSLVIQAERKFATGSQFIKGQLFRAQYALSHFSRKVEQRFGRDLYVNSILNLNGGYGHKYIPMRGRKFAEIRTIADGPHSSLIEIPIVRVSSEEGKIEPFAKKYRQVDIGTGELIGEDFFEDQQGIIVSEEKTFELHFVNQDNFLLESPNLSCSGKCPKPHKERLSEAVNFATKNLNLPEDLVRQELKKYVFPVKDRTELDFVKDWTWNNLKVPKWARDYKIDEPEIFYDLRNKETFDVDKLSESEARERIETIYPPDYEVFQSMGTWAELITQDYINKQAFKSQTFEDYFAIRNYCATGYRRISGNTIESKRMKNAIYRLAIRQSEDPVNLYSKFLFRGEIRLSEIVDELFVPGEELVLNKFSSTSTELQTAISFTRSGKYPYRKVVYEMEFSEPYLRADVKGLSPLQEDESILLPGTKFQISEVKFENEERDYVLVKLKHKHESITKAEWQMEVMSEIKKLQNTNTVFYVKDLAASNLRSKL